MGAREQALCAVRPAAGGGAALIDIVIVGAGGHGVTVAEALRVIEQAGGEQRAIGFVDDTPQLRGRHVYDLPVLGSLESIGQVRCDAVIVAIGSNAARREVATALARQGCRFASVVHPTASVATTALLGEGCYVGANAVIGAESTLGDGTIVSGAALVGHHCVVGAFVHVAPGVNAAGRVVLGDGCFVGMGANLLPDCAVGEASEIMAGALVSGVFGANCLIGGMPARVLRRNARPPIAGEA